MPRPRLYANDAEKQAAYRARNNKKTLKVDIDADLFDAMEQYMKFKDLTKQQVIEKLLTTQLLRKR